VNCAVVVGSGVFVSATGAWAKVAAGRYPKSDSSHFEEVFWKQNCPGVRTTIEQDNSTKKVSMKVSSNNHSLVGSFQDVASWAFPQSPSVSSSVSVSS
jgi:hypothetical protein